MVRRGQVTIFILVGIVLIIVFSIGLLARGTIIQSQLQSKAESMVSDYLHQNSITYYVEIVLEQVTLDVIRTVTEQGGVYNISGENAEDYLGFLYEGKLHRAVYGLKENTYCPDIYLDSPNYPLPRTYLRMLEYPCFTPLHNFFGGHTLPRLCDRTGENSARETQQTRYFCPTYNYASQRNKTVQGIIADAIQEELKKNIDFSLYEGRGHNVTLREDDIVIRVIYGLDNINIIAEFPFQVDVGGRSPVFSQRDFSFRAPVRLVKMHNFVTKLLEYDAQNYTFNIEEDYQTIPFYDTNFQVSLLKNACNECVNDEGVYDDVLRIEDAASIIENETLVFYTAIRNRRPALDWIHQTGGGTLYDIQALENQTLTLRPQGYDPDNTMIRYSYAGWKETHDARFEWERFVEGECGDFEECIIRDYTIAPMNWTNSPLYVQTSQYASINLTRNDTGSHIVTITIHDEAGLDDYQDVRILVFDLPVAVPNGTAGFAGLRNDQASKEDSYFLNASASRASMIAEAMYGDEGALSHYRWFVHTQNPTRFIFERILTVPEIWMPQGLWPTSFVNNITILPFNTTGWHEVNLTVTSANLDSNPESFFVNVHECIPYRNSTGLSPDVPGYVIESFSFPYNTTNSRLYDHTCCQGSIIDERVIEGARAYTDAVVCFNRTQWASIASYQIHPPYLSSQGNPDVQAPNMNTYRSIVPIPGHGEPSEINMYASYGNDLFRINFTRFCDGTRGNICTGPIQEVWERIAQCGDDFEANPSTQVERCQGPTSSIVTNLPQQCISYNYNSLSMRSFEQYLGINKRDSDESADGVCDPTPRCSSPGSAFSPARYNTGNSLGIAQGGGGCLDGGCNYAINFRSCHLDNYAQCQTNSPYGYISYVHSCVPLAQEDSCQVTNTQTLWARCEGPNELESAFCDSQQQDQNTHGRCGPTECCNANSQSGSPCYDPCEGTVPECIRTGDPFVTGQGRMCGDNPSCSRRIGGTCTYNGQSGVCDPNSASTGYCNIT